MKLTKCHFARAYEPVFIVVTNRQSDLPVDLETCVALAITKLNEAYSNTTTVYSTACVMRHGEQSVRTKGE